MSPEQLRGDAVDGRSDLFAFGIVLYELLTRRHPFTHRGDAGALSTWTAVLNEPPLPFEPDELARMPAGLPETIARCLEKDPDRRFPDASALSALLGVMLAPYGTGPAPPDTVLTISGDEETALAPLPPTKP
jgi:serine/threonine-protein kinase